MANQEDLGLASKSNNPYYISGKKLREVEKRYTVPAADVNDGDTYILAEQLSYADRIDSPNLKQLVEALIIEEVIFAIPM